MTREDEKSIKEALRRLTWAVAFRDHARSRQSVSEERFFTIEAAHECHYLLRNLLGRIPSAAEVNEVLGLD
jgi:hypothetical protein